MWHSPESNFTASAQTIILYNKLKNYTFKIAAPSPRGQWVNIVWLTSYIVVTHFLTAVRNIVIYMLQFPVFSFPQSLGLFASSTYH